MNLFVSADLLAVARCEFSLLIRYKEGLLPARQEEEYFCLPDGKQRIKLVLKSDFFSASAYLSKREETLEVSAWVEAGQEVEALLDLAFCFSELEKRGYAPSSQLRLLTSPGSGQESQVYSAHYLLPVLKQRLAHLRGLIETYIKGQEPFDWFEPISLKRCGSCPQCRAEIIAHRDMLLVPSLPVKVRNSIAKTYHISSIEELAGLEVASGVLPAQVEKYKQAARVELGWSSWEEISAQQPDDAALLHQQGYDRLPAGEDEEDTVQALLEATGKVEQAQQAEETLRQYLANLNQEPSGDDLAIAMVAAATAYHRLERSTYWQEHYSRLAEEPAAWEENRNVAIFERIAVEEPWGKDPEHPRRNPTRLLGARARLSEGSSLKEGESGLFLMYRAPFPPHIAADFTRQLRQRGKENFNSVRFGAFRARIENLEPVADNLVRVTVRESLPKGAAEYEQLPLALTPAQPLQTKAQETALAELAQQLAQSLPQLPQSAGLDLLRRLPPRLTGGKPLPAVQPQKYGSFATIEAIHTALTQLDSSYLAVQGPPGSGKTFLGAQVIGRLIDDGWKIGVVAQSHAVVENLLAGCIEKKTVAARQVAKFKGKTKMPRAPWAEISEAELEERLAQAPGLLIGGTAWDFASQKKFPTGCLDLLVIDEAGQYSLANTLAVARAARNLLLLGDPQQLPQVTQGQHDYPIDESALGWLASGYETLPPQLGYFLASSWRMHPALCAPVSQLSYSGQLQAAEAGSQRSLAGWKPGVYLAQVEHSGNTTSSPQEAQRIVRIAQDFLGSLWTPQADSPARPLQASDILVVAAYNAQVDAISAALEAAGLLEDGEGVRVGTVDKFQGQEAPVVIVSMAASSAGETARGADFLLSANRLNVALSRGQWCAVLVQSNQFTNFLPSDATGLKQLGRYLQLIETAHPFTAPRDQS